MATITRFEDLDAWKVARELVGDVYRVTSNERFARDFGLKDQIRRASVSIMSNIAEGFERGSSAEFHHFLTIAKASCAEVRSQLYLALDIGHIDQNVFAMLSGRAEEVSKIVGGLRAAVGVKRAESKLRGKS